MSSDSGDNEDHIVDNIISSEEEEDVCQEDSAPARATNGSAKPGSLPSPVVRSHNPVVTLGSYQVIIDNWIVTTAPLNTAPQCIDFETYENYKEIGWNGHCNLTIQ